MSASSASRAMASSRETRRVSRGVVAAETAITGRSPGIPCAISLRRNLDHVRRAHVDDQRRLGIGEPGPVEIERLVRLAMPGDVAQPRHHAALGQRHARRGRGRLGRRDAGNDVDLDAGIAQRLHLLAATAENERVAALEPDHVVPFEGEFDQDRVDVLLRDRMAARHLAHVDQSRVARGQRHDLGRDQPVMHDDRGLADDPVRLDRQQIGVAGTRADERDPSRHGDLVFHRARAPSLSGRGRGADAPSVSRRRRQ